MIGPDFDLNKRQRRSLLLVGLILGSAGMGAVVVYAAGYLSNTVAVSDGVTIGAPNGLNVTITESADINLTDPWPSSNAVEIVSSKGNITVTGPSGADVTVDRINGTWTNTSALDVKGNEIKIDPGDKPAVNVSGDTETLDIHESMAADDGTVDFVYSGSSGTTTVTLRGLSGNTQFGAVDNDTDTVLAVATSTAGGTVTFSSMPNSEHDVEIVTSKGGPVANDSSADPDGGVSTATPTLSIDVSDPDFPTGDNVTVEWFVDSSKKSTEYVQSNKTVTYTTSALDGGDHTWHVELTDEYGQTDTSNTFAANTPANLSIRLETEPNTFAKNVQVNLTAYYSGNIQRRQTSSGNISLTGFPIDEPIIVRASAENYTTRTAVIESVFEQNSIYLLNDSVATYLVRFNLRDPLGNYPPSDTVIFVERDLNQSGSVGWKVIAGDNFGVEGVPVDLKQDERYRLRIKNLDTGDSAVIGAYTTIQSETVTVEAGASTIDVPAGNRSYYWSFEENETAQHILFEYNDTADSTETIKVTIHERFNETNVLADNDTFTNTNDLVYQIPMNAQQVNKTWTAELYIDRGDGFEHYRVPISGGPVDLLPDILDTVWVQSVGVFVVLVSGMAFSRLNQGVGAVTTAIIAGLLWWVGLLEGVTSGAAVVLALAVSVIFHFRQRGDV